MSVNDKYQKWVLAVAEYDEAGAKAAAAEVNACIEAGQVPDWTPDERDAFNMSPEFFEMRRGYVLHNEIKRGMRSIPEENGNG